MRKVLLTGFEPFGEVAGNASWEAVKACAGGGIGGAVVEAVLLPVAFAEAPSVLEEAVARAEPDLVLAVGQAEGRRAVTVERAALNLVNAPIPDNTGHQPVGARLEDSGPDAYFTNLPLRRCVSAAREAGVPAAESLTAGSYVCNAVFYRLMHLAATRRPGLLGGFVHVPLVPWQSLDGAKATMPPDLAAAGLSAVVSAAFDAGGGADPPPTGSVQ